ncbi:N-acetyltransferase [Roseovarius sp. EL26]|uniref:GNAT family N-acetyltransferase n=1 Tax=Roseovarius sp. EL26 TaxID=2126672 RepID=UPI0020B120C9|nr:GNAT family N-acetyltransferase [Roseovarius sp. EL26]
MAPDEKALRFLEYVLDPAFALSAYDSTGELLGLAGYKTEKGAMVGGSFSVLAQIYGGFGALWRAGMLSVLEREVEAGVLLMDGIFVAECARGKGVGSQLLCCIKEKACVSNLQSVRLDVIDANPRARALYERHGFVARKTEYLGLLCYLYGFRSSTEMHCPTSLSG